MLPGRAYHGGGGSEQPPPSTCLPSSGPSAQPRSGSLSPSATGTACTSVCISGNTSTAATFLSSKIRARAAITIESASIASPANPNRTRDTSHTVIFIPCCFVRTDPYVSRHAFAADATYPRRREAAESVRFSRRDPLAAPSDFSFRSIPTTRTPHAVRATPAKAVILSSSPRSAQPMSAASAGFTVSTTITRRAPNNRSPSSHRKSPIRIPIKEDRHKPRMSSPWISAPGPENGGSPHFLAASEATTNPTEARLHLNRFNEKALPYQLFSQTMKPMVMNAGAVAAAMAPSVKADGADINKTAASS
mmetsp:Transcript_38774/g.75700  ORF Transcript_38774/g.75700 Transcript_38774/m.75700 type:complete len:306 (-) Transcript_38774:229-1146(-)